MLECHVRERGEMAIHYSALVPALIVVHFLIAACAATPSPTSPPAEETPTTATTSTLFDTPVAARLVADVMSVEVSGEAGAYTFSVEIESPDQGCEQYADWWEVVSEEGTLVYRRVLFHSHVDEQPFVRSGGPVEVDSGTEVWVRAHMAPGGYGGQALKGSVEAGFAPAEMPAGFAEELAEQPPLPDGCAWVFEVGK
jgi:hypothetical protein